MQGRIRNIFSFLAVIAPDLESETGSETLPTVPYKIKEGVYLSTHIGRYVQYSFDVHLLFIILVFQTYRNILTYRTLWCPVVLKTEDVMPGLAQPGP
jgi:hypothetical protein